MRLMTAIPLFVSTAALVVAAQPIPPGTLSPNKTVTFAGQPIGTTAADGSLALALDPAKSFVLLHRECTAYEVVERDSDDERRCERDSKTNNERGCARCEIAGWIARGEWKPNASPSTSSGSNRGRNLTIGAVLAAAATGGVIAATSGGGSSGTPSVPSFAGLSSTSQLNLRGSGACLGFTPTASPMLTITIDPTTGIGTVTVDYGQTRTDYANVRATRDGTRIALSGAGVRVPTPSRDFDSSFQASYDSDPSGRVTRRGFSQVFNQLTGPGSPCTWTYQE